MTTVNPPFTNNDRADYNPDLAQMTLRDVFAAVVLRATLADEGTNAWTVAERAENAYAMAAAMLRERSK